ncbi:hypothetical protein HK101_003616, partial [Irineochytrium annulatum]
MSTSPVVGFTGLGMMGSGMAHNLHLHLKSKGTALHVHNRTSSKCDPLVAEGAVAHGDLTSFFKSCDVVLSMVFDDNALIELFGRLVEVGGRVRTFVSLSTVSVEAMNKVVQLAKGTDIGIVSAPVFGRPDAARAKHLVCIMAGADSDKAKVKEYMDAMGRKTLDVGKEPHLGNVMKLVGNFHIVSIIEMLAEAQTLAEKSGLKRENVTQFVEALLPSPVTVGYSSRMAASEFDISPTNPGFTVQGGLKDVGLMQKLASDAGMRLPLAELAREHLQKQVEKGESDKDWASMVCTIRE